MCFLLTYRPLLENIIRVFLYNYFAKIVRFYLIFYLELILQKPSVVALVSMH